MTSITSQLKAPTTPSRPAAAPAPKAPESGPAESFTAGSAAPAPWLQKPSVESSQAQAKATQGQKEAMSTGKTVLLSVGMLAAGAGAAVGVLGTGSAQAAPASQSVQTQTSRHEKKAVENLSFLNRVAKEDGGGLKIDGTSVLDKLFNKQREATPQQAAEALRGGANVYFWESQGDEPVTIRSFEQLTEVTRDLKERVAQTQIEAGIKNIGEGLQKAGEAVRDKVGDIFR